MVESMREDNRNAQQRQEAFQQRMFEQQEK